MAVNALSPQVSVLIPAHNAATTLHASVRSILRQSWTNLEVIVVDDGSTDETAAVVERLAASDTRVRLFHQPNQGIAAALNAGLRECSGRYVARMDADDISLPWRIRRQVDFMERHPTVAASGTGVLPFQNRPFRIGVPALFPEDSQGIHTRLMFNPPIMHPTAIIRREIVDTEEFYDSTMPEAQDYALWTRLARRHRLSNISDICLFYRRSSGSISQSRRAQQQARARELRLENLAALCGDAFAARHAPLHLEMMDRRFEQPSLLAEMPGYVEALLAMPGVSRRTVENTWFGYCLAYSRTGREAAALFAEVRSARMTERGLLLRALALLSRRRAR